MRVVPGAPLAHAADVRPSSRRRVGAALVLLAHAAMHAPPAAAEPLRLTDALAQANIRRPAVRTAEAELDAARARLRQARLFPANPVLSADAARHTAPGGEDAIDRGVMLEQEIEVGGQRGLRIASAERDVERMQHLLDDRRRVTEGEVRRAFFSVAAAEQRARLAGDRLVVAAQLADATRSRFAAGDVGELELHVTELEIVRAEHERAVAETERARAVVRLADALGAPPGEKLAVTVEDDPVLPPPPEDTLVQRALEQRPDLAAARAAQRRFEAEAALAHRRGTVPNPVLRGFYREEQLEEHIVGGGLSIPLPVWNREQGVVSELLSQARAAVAEVARLANVIPRELHTALVHRAVAEETWRRYQHALPAADAAAKALERAIAGRYLGSSDALLQQDRLLQVRQGGVDAWLDLHDADSELREAVGGDPS